MRSSRCHSDLIMSKSTPSRPNPVVDRAPCCDAPYGLHSLGVEAQRIPTLAPGHIEAGIHQKPSPLLKQVRCQLHVLAFCCATCHMAGLPGICDVKLVSHTMGDGISPSAWSRGNSNPEKPTQGAPASAECPTPAEKSAHSDAHSTSESARWPRVLLEGDPAAAAGTTVAARALPAPLAAPPRPTQGPMELPEK